MTSIGFPQKFDKNVASIIAEYVTPKPQKFLDWILVPKLKLYSLCHWLDESLLEQFIGKFNKRCWMAVFSNPNTIGMIETHIDKLKSFLLDDSTTSWKARQSICSNVSANHILSQLNIEREYHERQLLEKLSVHEAFKELGNKNKQLYFCTTKSIFENSESIKLIEILLLHINKESKESAWANISRNPIAIHLLSQRDEHGVEQNPDKIHWEYLSANLRAMHLLERYTHGFTKNIKRCWPNTSDRCDSKTASWNFLSENPSAIEILKKNKDKIDISRLCVNPNAKEILPELLSNPYFFGKRWIVYRYVTIDMRLIFYSNIKSTLIGKRCHGIDQLLKLIKQNTIT
jgi:hypothetical protein